MADIKMMTSAYANKMLKKLNEDKEFWCNKESDGFMYVAAVNEEPVVPDYDFEEVSGHIDEIDREIVRIKHAINLANVTNTIKFSGEELTVDAVLVRMAQLNRRKNMLDTMRKQQPKTRVSSGYAAAGRNPAPEYRYINYDLELVKKEYDRIDTEIAEMQIALDKYNQTVEFEV